MKAVRFHEYGDHDVLRYEDAEEPVPGPDEVRIRVAATAFNPVDAGIRGGYLQEPFPVTLPHVPGIDVAGTVDAVGAQVTLAGLASGSSASCRWSRTARLPTTSSRRWRSSPTHRPASRWSMRRHCRRSD